MNLKQFMDKLNSFGLSDAEKELITVCVTDWNEAYMIPTEVLNEHVNIVDEARHATTDPLHPEYQKQFDYAPGENFVPIVTRCLLVGSLNGID